MTPEEQSTNGGVLGFLGSRDTKPFIVLLLLLKKSQYSLESDVFASETPLPRFVLGKKLEQTNKVFFH